ncbi:ATP-binding protein [Streptomyces sp. 6N223]|uniref:ATP-binding protein n=1 Tax=Streptomyces sp. 6N223 TaxID=3457412 RepID=UPI003FD384EE
MSGRDEEEERSGGDRSGFRSELSGASHEVVQAGSVSGGVHFHDHGEGRHRSGGGRGAPPRQLPGDVRVFVNRAAELERLNAVLPAADGEPLVITVCVIAGTAGVGKTSLALRWAHQVEALFPDGQLYVNLRGYDPQEPIGAHEALHRFLTALGVASDAVPADPEAAAALYRSLLADRRMLVVLDNAATVGQVRPLLPGNDRCLTIVTSRNRLSGLAIRDGAHRVTLGTLSEQEAVALLRVVTSEFRPEDDAERLADLARLCARLPLALRIAAERAASNPHMGLEELIGDLRDESALWDALSAGDGGFGRGGGEAQQDADTDADADADTDADADADAVRTVFAWSYRALPKQAARLFRLLGLHPGPDFGTGAASALAGVSTRRVRQLLDVLAGAHLLEQTAPDRYEFHDLLRVYAADRARREESGEGRAAALRRLLDWYLHTADAAQGWFEPEADRVPLEPPRDGVRPLAFADYNAAVDWAEREHANFLPAVRAAEAAGFDGHAWRLAAVLWNGQAPSAPVADWLALGDIALRAVRRCGDRAGEATLLEDLGIGLRRLNRLAESRDLQEEALRIRRELGDRRGEAVTLNALGLLRLRARELGEAAELLGQALAVFREAADAGWEAIVLSNRARVRWEAGLLTEAAEDAGRALAAHRAHGDRASVGDVLSILSALHRERGEPEEALRVAREAVEIALDLRDHTLEGYWLLALGDAQRELGEFGEAQASYHRSATLHRRLGDRGREALAWQGVGEVYARLGRDDEAAAFQRRAAAVHHELGDAWQEATALDALARAVSGGGEDAEDSEEERKERARAHWAEALRLVAGYDDARAAALRRSAETGCASLAGHGDGDARVGGEGAGGRGPGGGR